MGQQRARPVGDAVFHPRRYLCINSARNKTVLEPGNAKGNYRLGKDDLIVDGEGNSHITVGDYAKAMVDELETPAHHQERFTIGY